MCFLPGLGCSCYLVPSRQRGLCLPSCLWQEADDDVKAIAVSTEARGNKAKLAEDSSPRRPASKKKVASEASSVKPKRLKFEDEGKEDSDDAEAEPVESEAESVGEDASCSHAGSDTEDEDIFKGRFKDGKKSKGADQEDKKKPQPIEDGPPKEEPPSPLAALPTAVRQKLQMVSAELLDLLPVSVCTCPV